MVREQVADENQSAGQWKVLMQVLEISAVDLTGKCCEPQRCVSCLSTRKVFIVLKEKQMLDLHCNESSVVVPSWTAHRPGQ